MVLPTHYLWCHVAWCSRSILTIFWSKNFRDAHVCNAYIAILLHYNILWLDVSMEHSLVVHIFKAKYHASQHELRLLLVESSSFTNVISEVTTSEQVTNQIKVFSVLECVINIHKERMLQLAKKLLLAHYRSHRSFGYNTSL